MNDIVGKSKDHDNSMSLIETINLMGGAIQNVSKQLSNHEKRISKVEDTMRVNGIQEMRLTHAVNTRVLSWLGGKDSNAYNDRSLRGRTYSAINRELKRKFGVPRRSEIPAKDYEEAMEAIANWDLDRELEVEIQSTNSQLKLIEAY